MTEYGQHPSRRWIEDPGDPVWSWFVFNGPHGDRFSWHRDRPRHGTDVDLLREFLEEREVQRPGFIDSARTIALKAIAFPDEVMVRTAIQVLCVVGTDEDLEVVKPLLKHRLERIRVDAQCCLFERGLRGESSSR